MQRARSRAFLVTMGITVLLVAGVLPLIASELGEEDPAQIAVVGVVPEGFTEAVLTTAEALDLTVEVQPRVDLAAAERDLEEGSLDVILINGSQMVWARSEHPRLAAALTGALQALARQEVSAELGLTESETAQILTPSSPESRVLTPPDPEEIPRAIGAQAGTFVLYLSILIFGQFILLGIMEEKQSRVVEVVLSRLSPGRLLAGKIVGIGALGVVQIVVLGASVLLVASLIQIPDVELPSLSLGIIVRVLLWFFLGYSFYAALYGGMGATVSRQEDAQGSAMIPTLLIVPGLFVSLLALEDPDSLLSLVGSLVPFTSPMVMPVRMAVSEVPVYEVALAVVILIGSIYTVVIAAGRVYRGAVLEIGQKVRIRDAWRTAARS